LDPICLEKRTRSTSSGQALSVKPSSAAIYGTAEPVPFVRLSSPTSEGQGGPLVLIGEEGPRSQKRDLGYRVSKAESVGGTVQSPLACAQG
jgi:hypothetical protein